MRVLVNYFYARFVAWRRGYTIAVIPDDWDAPPDMTADWLYLSKNGHGFRCWLGSSLSRFRETVREKAA